MKKIVTEVLAILGGLLVAFPLVAPLIALVIKAVRFYTVMGGKTPGDMPPAAFWTFDWLIPGELFPLVIVGEIMLLVSAFVGLMHKKPAAWGIGLSVGGLVWMLTGPLLGFGGSAEAEHSAAWVYGFVVPGYGLYLLGMAFALVAAFLMLRDLHRKPEPAPTEALPEPS